MDAAKQGAQVSIEALLPAIYLDALDLACWRIDPEASQEFRKPLLMHYLHGSSLSRAATQRLEPTPRAPAANLDQDDPAILR